MALNENHRRVLVGTLAHIDGLLREAESAATSVPSPFSAVVPDLEKVEVDVVTEYLRAARAELIEAARTLGLPVPSSRVTATSSIQVTLTFAGIALEDVAPKRLRGYGALEAEAEALVERVEGDLARTLRRISVYLSRREAGDLAGRLERLERAPFDLQLLRLLQQIVTRRGFVELRPAIESLVEQAEAKTFEVAFFGRVSCGKSSLLNAVLGTDVLPVGVTPVTAVPTRLIWGESARATIHYADRATEDVPIERLADFVSEAGNPRNEKHVTRAIVRLPSASLRAGVVFVDTPGVGSLATSGARETFAYLPRCDLGVLLIAAGGTVEQEDVTLVRLLHEAGIAATVAISKCDLLTEPERVHFRDYVKRELSSGAGVDVPIHAVSVARADAPLALEWFATELGPVLANARGSGEASARRKLGALREQVVATLEALSRVGGGRPGGEERRASIEQRVLAGEGALAEARSASEATAERATRASEALLVEAASLVSAQIEHERPVDPRVAFEAALAGLSHRTESALRDLLTVARDRLNELLSEMSVELARTARPEPLRIDMLSAPVLHLPTAVASLSPRSASWLDRHAPMRERRILIELREHYGEPIDATVRAWSRELALWSAGVLAALGEQFGAQADPMRAQVRREVRGGPVEDAEGVATDLAAIRQRCST
jgi:GTP-binding protein EngB required for normal cell division